MVRVLQVVTHMNRGGLETMLMNYYRRIDRSQVQFDFLTHRAYDGDYGDEIKELGGEIYHLPMLNPFSHTYRKALRQFFQAHPEYTVIHVHQDCMSAIILKEAARQGIPVRIAHSHSSNQDRNIKYPLKLFYRRYIPIYATKLLACGEDAGQWMFCGAPFEILNNSIDAAQYIFNKNRRYEVRNQLHIPSDTMVIGHVGRFSQPKNHKKLVEIFLSITQKKEALLLLVGDGDLRAEIERQVEQNDLLDRVIFTGVRSDIPDLLQVMDVFVLPSLYEGLPVALVEAQATGLPCVISDRVPIEGRLTDLVRQLPLEENPTRWAEAVLDAAKTERRDTYDEIRTAGFDITENAKKLQEFYLKAAAGEKAPCLN